MSHRKILQEIWENCGEYLEHIPRKDWRYYVTPVLIRQLAKAREEIEYLKIRLDHATRHTGMASVQEKEDRGFRKFHHIRDQSLEDSP